jgi:SAM-dependent methyltransferase
MNFSLSGFIYQIFIDPFLSRLHKSIIENIEPSHRVIDIACGTGSQAIAIAGKAKHVTGIDLSDKMIATANRSARRSRVSNVKFELNDASDLSKYKDHEFDIAVTSMAIHQFEAELAVKIITEMRRIASKVIIVDYNYPMHKGFSRSVVWGIERFAGGDHYRNFRIYIRNEGIHWFTDRLGLSIEAELVRGNGVFVVVVGQ